MFFFFSFLCCDVGDNKIYMEMMEKIAGSVTSCTPDVMTDKVSGDFAQKKICYFMRYISEYL